MRKKKEGKGRRKNKIIRRKEIQETPLWLRGL